MHDNEVTITLVDAHEHERQFEFEEPQLCVVGRAHDCDIATPDGEENLVVSRHHCLLEIDPPIVRVHDLGSTNGTFVNGVKITRDRAKRANRGGIKLRDGDEVALGPVLLRVRVPAGAQAIANNNDFALEFGEGHRSESVGDPTERTVAGLKLQKMQV
jgi:serine/threonine-protein kinase